MKFCQLDKIGGSVRSKGLRLNKKRRNKWIRNQPLNDETRPLTNRYKGYWF